MRSKKFLSLLLCGIIGTSFVFATGCNDTQNTKIGSVSIATDMVNLVEGDKKSLDYTIDNPSGEDALLAITSSDENVVKIGDDGKLEAVGLGTAIVMVTTEKGYTDACVVCVNPVWGYGVATTPATCETDGVLTYVNALTGETKTETIPAYGHDYQYRESVAATYETAAHDVWVCSHDNAHVQNRNYRGNPLFDPPYRVNYYLQTISGDYQLVETQNLQGTDREEITVADYANVPQSHVLDTEKSDSKMATVLTDGSLVVDLYYKFASEINVKAYALAGYEHLQSVNVTFDEESVNATDTATLKLCDMFGVEKESLTANMENGAANFDLSDVENASDYYAVFTTMKTNTPEINSLKANYLETYKMTDILKSLYADATDKGTTTAKTTVNGVDFTFNSLTTRYAVDENGYVRAVQGTSASQVYNQYPFYWEFDRDTTVKKVDLSTTVYKSSYFELHFYATAGASYLIGGKNVPSAGKSKTLSVSVEPENFENWTGDMYARICYKATDTESYGIFHDMTVSYEKVLYNNQVNELAGLPKYSLSNYKTLESFTVEFEAGETAENATLYLLEDTGAIAYTRTAGISNDGATFGLANIKHINAYQAVVVTDTTQTPNVKSIVVEYKEIHDLGALYSYMYSSILAGTSTEVPTGYTWETKPVQNNYGWLQTENANVKFLYQGVSSGNGKFVVDANGKFTVNESVVAGTNGAMHTNPVKMVFNNADSVVSVSITQTVVKDSYFVWQWNNGDVGSKYDSLGSSGDYTTTIDTATSEIWNGTIYTLVYYNQNASSITLGDMVVTYREELAM